MNVESAAKYLEDRIRMSIIIAETASAHRFKWYRCDSNDIISKFDRAVADEYVPATVLLIEGLDNWLNPPYEFIPVHAPIPPGFWAWHRWW